MGGVRHHAGDFAGNQRFEVLARMGSGAMGLVFRARDRERDAVVALKLLRRGDAAALLRFKHEFRALADVSHRNLVTLYELIAEGEDWFFTMELVEGDDFLAHVRGDPGERTASPAELYPGTPPTELSRDLTLETVTIAGARAEAAPEPAKTAPHIAPPITTAVAVQRLRDGLRQLAAGIDALHQAGHLHRDIKPTNVLVDHDARVVILDFGVVTDLTRGTDQDESLVVGTPAYMAPEQAAGGRATAASDWYSVGVMLYEALAGRRPFLGSSREVMAAKQARDPRPVDEINAQAPADLVELCRDLMNRDPDARPTGAEVLRRLGADQVDTPSVTVRVTDDLTLIGREPHLAILREAYAAVRRGEARTVFAHGPSGIGKSALVHHFLAELRDGGEAVVLAGRCYERESVPYKALDTLIDELSRHLLELPRREVWELTPEGAHALVRVFPVLRRVEALGSPAAGTDNSDPHELRRRAFAALRSLLGALGERRPLVLWIDDLQWGDVDSAALLEHLTREPGAPPLLLLGGYRSEGVDNSPLLRSLLPARPNAVSLAVEPLTDADTERLASMLLGNLGELTASLSASIAREARGNPFFVTELVRFLEAEGKNRISLGGVVTLEQVLGNRLDALPDTALEILEVVAVAGRPISQAVTLRAAGLAGEEQATVLLRNRHLVRTGGVNDRDVIECFHDRIREVVLARLRPDMLVSCHRRLAAALEASGEADPEALATHFEGAADRDRAHHYAVLAADRAAAALAFDRAAALYRRALKLRTLTGEAAASLQGRLGDALANDGQQPEAAAAYLEAARTANEADVLEYRRRAAESFLRSGHVDEGVRALQEVLAGVGLGYPSPRRALATLALRRMWIRLRGLGFRERDPSRVSPLELRKIDACWTASLAFGMCDSIRGADFQARHLLLALRSGQRFQVTRALNTEAAYAALSGRSGQRRANRIADRAGELADQLDHPYTRAWNHTARGLNDFMMGRYRQAYERSRAAEQLFAAEAGQTFERVSVQLYQVWSLFYLGELGELAVRVPELLRDAQERGDIYAAASVSTGLPNAAWLIRGDVDGARRIAAETMERWSRQAYYLQHYWWYLGRQNVELYAGEPASALRHADEGWPALRRSLMLHIVAVKVEALHARARCALAAAAAGRDAGPLLRLADRAARAIDRCGLLQSSPVATLQRAGAAAVRGDQDTAATLLERAAAGFDEVDMAVHAAAARRRLGRLLGGDRGAELVVAADQLIRERGAAEPARITAMLAPGFADE